MVHLGLYTSYHSQAKVNKRTIDAQLFIAIQTKYYGPPEPPQHSLWDTAWSQTVHRNLPYTERPGSRIRCPHTQPRARPLGPSAPLLALLHHQHHKTDPAILRPMVQSHDSRCTGGAKKRPTTHMRTRYADQGARESSRPCAGGPQRTGPISTHVTIRHRGMSHQSAIGRAGRGPLRAQPRPPGLARAPCPAASRIAPPVWPKVIA